MPVPKFVQSRKTTLKTSISASEVTSIVLKDLKDIYGNALAFSDYETTLYLTFEPASDNEEIISCTGFTVNADGSVTLDTGITRGLSAKSPYASGGTARTHAAGVVVIAGSNHPQLYDSLADFMVNLEDAQTVAGLKTFSTNPKTSAGNPTADEDLARKAYVDSVITSGAITTDSVIIAGTAGETVAAGDLIYFDTVTANEWLKCDANTAATVDNVLLGIAQGAGTDGNPITGGVMTQGIDNNQAGLTTGNIIYASDTAGDISESAGTVEVTIGIAYDADSFMFYPRMDQQITEQEQDALEGTSGTPSSANKYVTADDVATDGTTDKIIRLSGTNYPAGNAKDLTNTQITKWTAGETIAAGDPLYVASYAASGSAYDTSSSGNNSGAGATFSDTVTVAANSNRLLLCACTISQVAFAGSITGVTYNGVSMTALMSDSWNDNSVKQSLYYLLAPATGANTLVVTGDRTTTIYAATYSFYNIAQQAPEASSSDSGANQDALSAPITTLTNRALVFAMASNRVQGFAGTAQANNQIDLNVQESGHSGEVTPISQQTLTGTADNSGYTNAIGAWSFAAADTSTAVRVYKAGSATAGVSDEFVGFAYEAGTAGNDMYVCYGGINQSQSGLTAGERYYLNDTVGTIGTSAGTVTRKVGIAVSPTEILITNIW